MTEDRYQPLLNDFLDGALSGSDHRGVETHLKTCERCRTDLAELTAIRDAAASLDRLDPPPGVWERVRDALSRAPETRGESSHSWKRAGLFALSHRWWALAATLLVSAGALVLVFALAERTPPEGSPEWVFAELQLAEGHYQNAIRGLEKIVAEGEATLDPEITAVLRQNLTVIEDAIVESRDAARATPANPAAGESLLAALRQKVALLQNTVLLINEIRKGQGEGAVNILNEMRDSETAKDDSPS